MMAVAEKTFLCSHWNDGKPGSVEAPSGTNPDDHHGQRKGDTNRATYRQRERR
jgi:hypothetical protein